MPEMFVGTTIISDSNKKYIMPTLGGKAYREGGAFKKIKMIEDCLKKGEDGKNTITDEAVGYMYDLTTYALQRNYPDMTLDDVENEFGFDILMDAFAFIVSRDKEKTAKGLKEMASKSKNAQGLSTKKAK